MSAKRFQQIKRYFHLNDNNKKAAPRQEGYDRLFHVRPLLDHMEKVSKAHYDLGTFVSVDESMVPFKGRSFMMQYLKDKPCKWGFKIWAACCSTTGYFFSLRVYAGKGSTEEVHGLATDSVTTLIDAGGVRKGSVVFFDRWFTSPLLLLELLDRGIYGVGTVMLNRSGLPTDLKMLKCTNRHPIEAVEMHLFQAAVNLDQEVHQLYAVSWMDKKPVSFVGSAFGLKTTTCQRTCKATGTR
jgi:hypothetical protein